MVRQASLIAFLALTLAPLVVAQDSSSAANSIASALGAKQYDQALQLARSALQQSPKDLRILTMEGLALSGLGRNREALAAYHMALQMSPDYVPALEGAAELEYKAGSDRAVPLLNHLLELHPNDPTSHAMLAALAYNRRDCDVAVKHFREAGALISTQASALAEYGGCLIHLKKTEEAIPVFEELVALSPDDSRARFNLALVQYLAHHTQDAILTLQPLLESSNPDADALDLASAAYEESSDTPRAVALLRQAILTAPRNLKYYLDFATLSYDHASFQVGIDVLNAGLTQLPNSAPLYLARGILYIQLADYDKGEADFETADRVEPRQAFTSEAQGLVKFQQGNLDEALASVQTQLKSHPENGFLHYLLAEILIGRGAAVGSPEFKRAIEEDARALQLRPDLVLARDALGRLYLQSGQFDKAIEQARLALRANPSDQEAIYHLIQALRKSGNKNEIPDLLKRLAVLREEARTKEASQNRYKFVEGPTPQAPNPPQQP